MVPKWKGSKTEEIPSKYIFFGELTETSCVLLHSYIVKLGACNQICSSKTFIFNLHFLEINGMKSPSFILLKEY